MKKGVSHMEQDNLEKIVLQTQNANKLNTLNLNNLLTEIKETLDKTFNVLEEANKIDLKNNNGFKVELSIFDNIIDNCLKEEITYGKVIDNLKNDEKKYYYGKEIESLGTICLIFDGNPYTLLELILRNLIVNNSLLISYNGYMYGTNNYLVEAIKNVLTHNQMDSNQINIYANDNIYQVLNYYTSYDLVIAIGNRELQNNALKQTHNKIITSGYENFDLYIESLTNLDFIKAFIKLNNNITIYYQEDLNIDIPNAIPVNNLDEAIYFINTNGSLYSTSIFTDNKDNAHTFIKEVKSKQVLVNTSPLANHPLDINETSLCNEKIIIYP